MPTYDYDCPQCGGFEALRTLAGRNEPAECPDCGSRAPRVFVSAPRLGCLTTASRRAHDLNERARHEPQHSGDYT
ncbi:FmdB family transcriptional regulator, partial [Pelomonas sp. HMWF004]